jgi:hypothetical protein
MPESTIFPGQGLRIWPPNSVLISDVCIAEVEEYAYTDYNYENYKNYGDYYEEPDTEEKGKWKHLQNKTTTNRYYQQMYPKFQLDYTIYMLFGTDFGPLFYRFWSARGPR